LALGFCAGANHLAGTEDQGGGLGLLQAINESRKLFWAIFDTGKDSDYSVEIDLLFEGRRRDNVLDVDEGPTLV
jgi:hypothetical protein